MNKLTAVEWFAEVVAKMGYVSTDILEQAKEMEKDEMHSEYMRGWKDGLTKQGPPPPPLDRKIYK